MLVFNSTPLAQAAETALTKKSFQLDWPETGSEWALFAGFALAAVYVVWMYLRDTRGMSAGWTVWLALLRLGLLAGLACGLMLLGGEPISAAMAIPAMALVAIGRHGGRDGLVATSIFAFIQAWNEYIVAYVVLSSQEKQTLTIWLASFTMLARSARVGR